MPWTIISPRRLSVGSREPCGCGDKGHVVRVYREDAILMDGVYWRAICLLKTLMEKQDLMGEAKTSTSSQASEEISNHSEPMPLPSSDANDGQSEPAQHE